MNLYEYVVIHRPEDKCPEIMTEGKVFADGEDKANDIVVAGLADDLRKKIRKLEVLVRPFA